MQYIPPINGDTGNPNRAWVNAAPGVTEGSIPPGAAFEHPMREILEVITHAGLVPSGGDLTQLRQAIIALASSSGAGPGQFLLNAAAEPLPGTLECNGAAISRTTYAALFGKIGTAYGAGDGETTFNVPESRGIFPRGWDNGRGIDIGRVFGSLQQGSLQTFDVGSNGVTSLSTDSASSGAAQNSLKLDYLASGATYPGAKLSDVSSVSVSAIGNTGGGGFGIVRPSNFTAFFCIKY